MARLEEIEGIGPAYRDKLAAAGISTVEGLLEAGGTGSGRTELATRTGISQTLILEWVNHADLFRLKGVGGEYADLLEAAGVDSVPELAQRNPANLAVTLARVNEEKKLVRSVPTEAQIAGWIEQAKTQERAVRH